MVAVKLSSMPLAVDRGHRTSVPRGPVPTVVCRSSTEGAVTSTRAPGAAASATRTVPAASATYARPATVTVAPSTGAPVSPRTTVTIDPAATPRGDGDATGVGVFGRRSPPPHASAAMASSPAARRHSARIYLRPNSRLRSFFSRSRISAARSNSRALAASRICFSSDLMSFSIWSMER